VRDGDHLRDQRPKRFITNAPIADLFTVFARTDAEGTKGANGITAFLVERGTPGSHRRAVPQDGPARLAGGRRGPRGLPRAGRHRRRPARKAWAFAPR
jgi:alkylation response protein AidB-like acyl-CoA dehydrogenase